MSMAFPATAPQLGLYPVVDNTIWIARLLKAGVRTIQLRIKDQPKAAIEAAIIEAVQLAKHYDARLFINDYWRLAIRYQAYGVHLGQQDLDTADRRAIHQAGLRLGVSTHDEAELERALAIQPSYIALGHIYPTRTKEMPSSPQGLIQLKHHMQRLRTISTVAIGGITIERAPAVMACGVGSIAVVSAITQAPDWHQATRTLLSIAEPGR